MNKELCIKVGKWNNSILWCTVEKTLKKFLKDFFITERCGQQEISKNLHKGQAEKEILIPWSNTIRSGIDKYCVNSENNREKLDNDTKVDVEILLLH